MKRFVALALIASSWSLHAEVYKCKDAAGKVSISDQPCPTTSRQEVRRDEFVTQEQNMQARKNVASMQSSLHGYARENCLAAARLRTTKYAIEKATAACDGRTLKEDDDPPAGNFGARIKNCNAWGCYDTSGNYYPR